MSGAGCRIVELNREDAKFVAKDIDVMKSV